MAAAASSLPPDDDVTAESYIGSLITLTTKAEIRYEGIILQLDTRKPSIFLRDVRTFGTEGRRKDGPQIPPSDIIYDYIIFRGSDLTDLKVISLPDAQNPPALPHDPAIMQNHPQASSSSCSLAPPGTLQGTNVLPNVQLGHRVPSSQGNLPPSQSTEAFGTCPSFAPVPPLNNNRPPLKTYMPGLTGLAGGTSHSQVLPFSPPSPGLSFRDTTQQPGQPTNVNAPFAGPPSVLESSHVPLAISSSSPMVESGSKSVHFAVTSDSHAVLSPPTDKARSLHGSGPSTLTDDPMMSAVGTSSSRSFLPRSLQSGSSADVKAENDARTSKLYPNMMGTKNPEKAEQLQKPPNLRMHEATSSSHYGNMCHRRGQVYGGTYQAYQSHRGHRQGQGQGQVMHEATSSSHYGNRHHIRGQAYQSHKGRGRGESQRNMPNGGRRGNYVGINNGRQYRVSQPVTRFTEDFDFETMNKKFNKAEVWGAFSRGNPSGAPADEQKADESDVQMPVYQKDDFFDSISCHTLDAESGKEKITSSELNSLNVKTFDVHNPQRERTPGQHWQTSSRGSYRGTGSKNAGWGRGKTRWN